MDAVFELVFQLLFELLAEALFEAGFRGTARALRGAPTRLVLAVVAGGAFGLWWGDRLSDVSLGHRPRLLWVSLALGVVALVAAAVRRPTGPAMTGGRTEALRTLVDPRRWGRLRLLGLAVLNLAIAVGIAVTYHPMPVNVL